MSVVHRDNARFQEVRPAVCKIFKNEFLFYQLNSIILLDLVFLAIIYHFHNVSVVIQVVQLVKQHQLIVYHVLALTTCLEQYVNLIVMLIKVIMQFFCLFYNALNVRQIV